MHRLPTRLSSLVGRLWRTDARLTAVGLLMLGLLAAAAVGIVADPRTITGVPAWLKPAKFSASIAIYTLTLAWVFGYLPGWTRTRRIVGWTTAVVMLLEWVIIAAQAWRGTTSHFNAGTLLDATLFGIMGTAIVVQTVVAIAVAVALWRQPFDDRAIGWALRLGMAITIVGAFSGGLMTRPTPLQLDAARAGARMTIAGAHTVGAPDGGPGLPGTGWSTEHGDLRIPHFAGLHALQALALLALALRRSRPTERVQSHLVVTAGASYAALFGLLLWQALRAQSVLHPDAATVGALLLWAAASGAAAWIAATRPRLAGARAMAN